MKRLLFFGLPAMFMLLVSCGDKTADSTTSTSSGNDKQKEMLESNRKVLKAIETGDSAVLKQYIADDATDHGGGKDGADMKGGAQIIHELADVHNHIDNMKFEVVQEAANGDHLFCMARMTGKVKSPVWGMPAGMDVDMTSVDVIKIKDGKMVDHWSYMNPADMMKMMPPPPPIEGKPTGGK